MTQSWLSICISKQPKLLRHLKTGSSWKEKTHQWAVSCVPVPSTTVTCWWGGPTGAPRPHSFVPIPNTISARHSSGGPQTPWTPSEAKAVRGGAEGETAKAGEGEGNISC